MSDATTRIADLPSDDKPREKALKLGVDKLTTTELIAIALGSGLPGKSVIDLSREILQNCNGDLVALQRLDIKEMCRRFKGIGPAKAIQLLAAIELGRRCSTAVSDKKVKVTTSQVVYDYIRPDMSYLDHEEFRVLYLDRGAHIRDCELISSGGTTGTVVDIKIILKHAINSLCDSIILAHNHPSGTLMPSPEDDKLTRKIVEAARTLDIRVLDHIIVSHTGYYSYNDNGRL